jgi:hypothetical protein
MIVSIIKMALKGKSTQVPVPIRELPAAEKEAVSVLRKHVPEPRSRT